MESRERGYNEKQASLGNLNILGGQLVHDILLLALPKQLSTKDLINLCSTSFALREIFKRAIANQFLAMVIDVNHLCKSVSEKIKLIKRIIEKDPSLMFMKARAGTISMSACEYVYAYPDTLLQFHFLGTAFKHGMLDTYVKQCSTQPLMANIDHLRSLFTKHLELLQDLQRECANRLTIPENDVQKLRESELKRLAIVELATILAKTQISHAEIEELPRCVLDVAIKPSVEPIDIKHVYDEPTELEQYHLYDDGEGEFSPRFLDLLDHVGESGKPGEVEFILSADRYQDGKLAVRHRPSLEYDEVERDQQYLLTLFDRCIKKTRDNQRVANGFLKLNQGKK